MHYVFGDIHNEFHSFKTLLKRIKPTEEDTIILLGDLFDRGFTPDPVRVYFEALAMEERLIWLRGNHDRWLADYIKLYYGTKEKRRKKLAPYAYNTFALMNGRLTPKDMLDLADRILETPLQAELQIGERKFLLAHARTSNPAEPGLPEEYYLSGGNDFEQFVAEGVEGYISLVGHTPSSNVTGFKGHYLDGENTVWCNEKESVYFLDCGSGFGRGKLACLCLETGERYYAE